MKQPQPYSAKYRQFKSLSKKVNRLISSGRFAELSREIQEKLILKLKGLYQQLQGIFSPKSLKRILASAAALLGFQVSGQAQFFAPPVSDTLGLKLDSTYFKCPTLVDLDADGDFDLLTGEYDGAFIYYENNGNAQMPSFSDGIVNPFNLDTLYFLNLPTTGDLDDDGDFDILSVEYYSSIRYYENNGDAQNPSFTDQGSNPFGFIPGYTAFGTYFYMPSLVDLDGDGDLDLVVGGTYYDMAYYENVGTPSAPSFANPQKDFFGLPDDSTSYLLSQTFADFDNDGDYDMVTVAFTYNYDGGPYNSYYWGVFKYFENVGTPTSPSFQESPDSKFSVDTLMNTIPIGVTAADLDDDGDVDIIFGGYTYDYVNYQEYAGLYYVENLQSPSGILQKSDIEVVLSPNPASDFLNVSIADADPELEPELFELVNVNGNKVLSQDYYDTNTRLDVRSLPAGNYFIIARRDGKAIGTRKVVITK